MLANFFGKSNPANYIILFVVFIAYASGAIFGGYIEEAGLIKLISLVGGVSVLFFLFNLILTKIKLTLYNTYGFMFFVLLLASFPQTFIDSEALMINILLLIMLRRVYSLQITKSVVKKMFDSGFWLGILFILDPFMVVFAGLIYSSIALFQKLDLRNFLIPILGFATPLICYFSYCFWNDMTADFYQLFYLYTDYNYVVYAENEVLVPIIIIGIVTLISIVFKTPRVIQVSGDYRVFWTLVIFNLLVSIIFVLLTKDKTGAELLCTFFPLAVILTNGIEGFSKSLFKDIVIALFVLMPIILFII